MFSRLGLRSLVGGAACCRRLVKITSAPYATSVRPCTDAPPQPFSNLPFQAKSKFGLTLFFAVVYGVGLWAPFIIVWYSMAKKTM